MNCKKCNASYSNDQKKCPKCGYRENPDDSLIWIDEDPVSSDTFSDESLISSSKPKSSHVVDEYEYEDSEIDISNVSEIDDVFEDSEIYDSAAFDNSTGESFGKSEAEDVFEDSEIEDTYENSEIPNMYEVPEIAPNVYEDSIEEIEVEEFSKEDLLRDSSIEDEAADGDRYKATILNEMPDDYEEELTDAAMLKDPGAESVGFEESDDGYDEESVVFEESEDAFNEDPKNSDENGIGDESMVFEPEGEIYEDSVLGIEDPYENSVVAGLKSDVYKKDDAVKNHDIYDDVEWSQESYKKPENVADIENEAKDLWLKCPLCHREQSLHLVINSTIHKTKCKLCYAPYLFFISQVQKVIVKEGEKEQEHSIHLKNFDGEKKELQFSYEKNLVQIEKKPAVLIYTQQTKKQQSQLSVIGCLHREFYVVNNVKQKIDINRILIVGFITCVLLMLMPNVRTTQSATPTKKIESKTAKKSSKVQTKPLEFSHEILKKNGTILVRGTTNLPDNTIIEIGIKKSYGKKINYIKLKVKDQKFQTKELRDLSEKGKPQKIRGKIIVEISCDLYRSWEGKNPLQNYVGNQVKKEKTRRGVVKKIGIQKRIKMDNYNEKKEGVIYKLQQWTKRDISRSSKWNSNYYVNILGQYIQYNPKKGDEKIIQCYFFPKADLTMIVNLYEGKVVKWGIGKK